VVQLGWHLAVAPEYCYSAGRQPDTQFARAVCRGGAPASPRSGKPVASAAQNLTQGQQVSGELAAAYSNGTLIGPAFLASVSRVIALRQSLK
jgi:hypothetical protein